MKIISNFYQDWINILKKELENYGANSNNIEDNQEISFKYFNIIKRIVEPIPRAVYYSDVFTCPDNHKEVLVKIENRIRKGETIIPHLSRRLMNLNYNDLMLNDWGVHHLHLSSNIEKDGFVTRTEYLLFVRFQKDNAFFINIYNHKSWTKQNIIKIIHDNWPESIQTYKMRGVKRLSQSVTNENIKQFRNAHMNSMVEVEPGIIYSPLGGGISTSGLSIDVVTSSDRYARWIINIEKHLKENIDLLLQENNLTIDDNELNFHLEFIDNCFCAINSKYSIKINCGNL
jgi:hypothetical protein